MPSVSSQPGRPRALERGRDAGRDVVPGGSEEQPGLGAELAGAEGEGADEPGGDLLRPSSRRGGHHDRVHGAHLGVHGDDDVPLDGQSPQRQAAALGTREGDGGDLGAAHQGLARLEARDQPERPLGCAGVRERGGGDRREERAGLADGPGAPSRPPGTRRRSPIRCRCPRLRTRRGSCSRRARRPGRAAPASGAGPGWCPWRGRRSRGGTTLPRRRRRRSAAGRRTGRARWSAAPRRARSRGRRPAPARRRPGSPRGRRRPRPASVGAPRGWRPRRREPPRPLGRRRRAPGRACWSECCATTVPVRASWLRSLIDPTARRRRPRSRRVRRRAGRR